MIFEHSSNAVKIPFIKMQGTGNDFVIIDCRDRASSALPNVDLVRIADRKRGIGCDQTVFLCPSASETCKMIIYNPDGSQAETCGNALRCVFWLITSKSAVTASVELTNRVVFGERLADGRIKVNMGKPLYDWNDIPLNAPHDTLDLPLQVGCLKSSTATNMGNPHVTFFVDNLRAVPFEELAPSIERNVLFPNRVNVTIAKVVNEREIEVRIWERGTGITESCGSAACATLIAAIRRGLIRNNKANIKLPGGTLTVEFDGENVYKTGEAVLVFAGDYYETGRGDGGS